MGVNGLAVVGHAFMRGITCVCMYISYGSVSGDAFGSMPFSAVVGETNCIISLSTI